MSLLRNPQDPKGSWCVLAKGQSTAAGSAWDYCPDACNTAAPPADTASYPKAYNCKNGFTGLPGTSCTCSNSYAISFQGYGTKYTGQSGCTEFEETGSGMCVTTCTKSECLRRRRGSGFGAGAAQKSFQLRRFCWDTRRLAC